MNTVRRTVYIVAFCILSLGCVTACGGSQTSPAEDGVASSDAHRAQAGGTVHQVERPHVLPNTGGDGATWFGLVAFSQVQDPSPKDCASSLEFANAWWEDLRQYAQALFSKDEAPDEETIEAWTVERRQFFENWLNPPQPILVLDQSTLRLSKDVGAVFQEWASCTGDSKALKIWRDRTVDEN